MHPTPDTISNSSRVRQSQIANCKSQIPSLRNGFSLPELLVVIAILAVLISMLLPTVNKIRSTAVSIQCLSNIRQLTLTSLTYAAESDGWFPPFYYQPRSGAPRDWWYTNLSFRAMVGYTYRWPENFLCPLSRAVIAPNGWDYGAIQYSYGFNNSDAAGNGYSAPNPNNGPNRLIARQMTQIPSPSSKILFLEASLGWSDRSHTSWSSYTIYGGECSSVSTLTSLRHNQGANFAFYDGHAEWRHWTDVAGPITGQPYPDRRDMWSLPALPARFFYP